MAGRRFFQRGHASFPAPYLSRTPGLPMGRLLTMAALVLGAGAIFLLASTRSHTPAGDPVSMEGASPAAAPVAHAPPSLLVSAMAKVQDAAHSLADPGSPGLPPVRLSGQDIQQVFPLVGREEARLIEIYQLISQTRHREALTKAEALVRDHPNFQLANLVLGDLLSLQARPVRQLGDVPDTKAVAATEQLSILREESRRRLMALTERPPEGSVPAQFLTLSAQSKHAIAIDAARSRLYLFENTAASPQADGSTQPQLKLVGDYYISVGLLGIEKVAEGDKRTPLGVYYITSNLNPANLPDLYGAGALPINYPNPLDLQRGKTGSGIWLHGTPREQFVRAPQASDGCVVLSNPDLKNLLSRVQIRTTPVVIAPELHWVQADTLNLERQHFQQALEAWRSVKSQGDLTQLKGFYSSRFDNQGQKLADWWPKLENEVRSNGVRDLQIKDLSMLNWRDKDDTMVVTFGEVAAGQSRGVTKRQYWMRERDQWKIFYEGIV